MIEKKVAIKGKLGMRDMALFVKESLAFECEIKVKNGEQEANAKSYLSLMTAIGAGNGPISIRAEGRDEQKAISALLKVLEKS